METDIFEIETELSRRHIYALLDALNRQIADHHKVLNKALDYFRRLQAKEIDVNDIDLSPHGFDYVPPIKYDSEVRSNGAGELGVQLLSEQEPHEVEAGR
jgi:hypothetical protein